MRSKSIVREDEAQNFLLVEGKDDEHVLYSLFQWHNIPEQFKVKSKEGINKLLDTLDVELDRSGLTRLGIVVDADMDISARWQALRNRLIELGYEAIPSMPESSGTIIRQDGRPIVGIWLMPDNTLPGMLEHFVSLLISDSDRRLWMLAEQVVEQVSSLECRFSTNYTIKAHIYTYLAWQEEPGTPMGLAITKKYFDANASHVHQFLDWLRRLFEL